ncbi:MAG: TIGR02646 family protein [Candidatus Aminicenantes bacterium]|nr:TIGR02646 family protein [Candidatus Aminicenantes bacterium]
MRSIKKDFLSPPPGLVKFAAKHMDKMLDGDDNPIKSCKSKVRKHLETHYLKRCAYCESTIGTTGFSRVDHFRPIAKYRWLAMEWSNLLLSCEKCNEYKSDSFPLRVEKKRVINPGKESHLADSPHMMDEGALLLNPELDDASEHITFSPDGSIKERNGSEKGRTTIDICKLDRDELTERYKKQIGGILYDIKDKTIIAATFYTAIKTDEDLLLIFIGTFQALAGLKNPGNKYVYTQLGTQMYEEFEDFFVRKLPGNEDMRFLVRRAFELFRQRYFDS